MLANLRVLVSNVIWPAVASAVLAALAIVTSLYTDNGSLVLALGLSAIASACLAQTV